MSIKVHRRVKKIHKIQSKNNWNNYPTKRYKKIINKEHKSFRTKI